VANRVANGKPFIRPEGQPLLPVPLSFIIGDSQERLSYLENLVPEI
jgi:hypothetical protein